MIGHYNYSSRLIVVGHGIAAVGAGLAGATYSFPFWPIILYLGACICAGPFPLFPVPQGPLDLVDPLFNYIFKTEFFLISGITFSSITTIGLLLIGAGIIAQRL